MPDWSHKKESDALSYEFYVSAGSKDLIRRLNDIMRRHGYIGLADGGGRMHYVVDGSKNLYEAASNIRMILREQEESLRLAGEPEKSRELKRVRRKLIEELLEEKGLKPSLKGFIYLRDLLEMLADSAGDFANVSKQLYDELCSRYQTGRKALDRVIHYSLKKAGISLSNSEAIAMLSDELERRLAGRPKTNEKADKADETEASERGSAPWLR